MPFATVSFPNTSTYGDHVLCNKANATSPALRRPVQNVVYPESLVLGRERIKVLLEQDILLGDIGKDQVDLGGVASGTAADDGANDLEHGCDAGTAGDHAEVTDHVGLVHKGALGAPDADALADREPGHVLGDVTGGVRLDQQVDVAGLLVTADRGVGPHNLFAAAVGLGDVGADGDVLADGKTKDRRRRWELDTVAARGPHG